MTAALEGGEWSAARLGRTLPPGKTRYPFYRRLGGPQGRSGRAENLVPAGTRSPTVQPVVSRYTDWATQPTIDIVLTRIYPTIFYKGNPPSPNIHTFNRYCKLQNVVLLSFNRKKQTVYWLSVCNIPVIMNTADLDYMVFIFPMHDFFSFSL
jgi:hypothetical protein